MNEVATVTITVDEYFDLRSRAETNLFLTSKLGDLENRLFDFDRRIFELETRSFKNG